MAPVSHHTMRGKGGIHIISSLRGLPFQTSKSTSSRLGVAVLDRKSYALHDSIGIGSQGALLVTVLKSVSASSGDMTADEARAQISELRATQQLLQDTINSLRLALETEKADQLATEQAARAAMASELSQLQATVNSMRVTLEEQTAAAQAQLQHERAANRQEVTQLQVAIDTLRHRFEAATQESQRVLEAERASAALERKVLQDQIVALRGALERRD